MRKTTNKILSALIAASMVLGMMTTATAASEPDNGSGTETVQETVETSTEDQQEPAAEETPAAEQSEEKQEEAAVPAESTEAEEPEQTGQKEEQTVEDKEEQTAEQPGQEQEKPAAEEEKEDAADAVTEEKPQAAVLDMPAQTLTKSVKVTDSNNKKSTVTVTVTAPEGAFPKKSKIVLRAVGPNDQAGGSGQTVLEAIQDTTSREILNVVAAEIAFTDAKGNEIEPAVPVKVSVKNAKLDSAIAPADSFYLVRIKGNGDADQMDQVNIDQPNLTASFACDESAVYAITQQAEAAAFVQQPEDQKVFKNTEAAFKAEVNLPYDTYQWQYSKDGGNTWKNLSKTTYGSSDSLTFTAKASYDGYQYRCVVTLTDKRKITSDAAALTIDKPAITEQPADQTADTGDTVAFSVEAYGEMKACQWQYSKNAGETWKNLSVKTYGDTNVLSFTMKKSYDGYQYRCRITFTDGTKLTSDAGQLHWAAAVAMPAVKLTSDADGADIKITAPEGALPEGTSLGLETVDTAEVGDVSSLVENGTVLYAADISFEDPNGDSVEPAKNVSVSLTVDGADWNENCRLVHVSDDGSKELISNAVFSGDKVTFSNDAFSVYAVVESGSTEPEARVTVNFYGKNTDSPIATFYVKNSDTPDEIEQIVYDPGVGELDQSSRELFAGWSVSTLGDDDGKDYTLSTEGKKIDEIRDYLAALPITEDDVLNIYGMIFKTYTVTYLDEEGKVLSTFSSQHLTSETESDHTVNLQYTPATSTQNFEGWLVSAGETNITSATYDDQACQPPYKNGTELKITGDVTLSVSAPYGHWLVFDENGKDATYNAPQFVKEGDVTAPPALEMIRPGYTFEGWYEENQYPDGNQFVFGQELTDNITVKAKWKVADEAPYTVIVWKQSVKDNYDAADADKTYDFVFYERPTEVSNKPVSEIDLSRYTSLDGGSITVDGTDYSFYGFKYNTTRGPVSTNEVILPNGTTVINIYYDREVVSYGFKIVTENYTKVSNPSVGNTYYANVNGTYYPITITNENISYIVNGRLRQYTQVELPTYNDGNEYYYSDSQYIYPLSYYNRSYWRYRSGYSWQYVPVGTTVYRADYYDLYRREISVSDTDRSFTGLYGQKLNKYGYEWPMDYRWFNDLESNTFTSIMDMFSSSVNEAPTDQFHSDFYGYTVNLNTSVYHYLQNVDGTWPGTATYEIPTAIGNGMVFRNFQGFTASQFRIKLPDGITNYLTGTSYSDADAGILNNPQSHTTSDGWTEWLDQGTAVEYTGNTRHETTRWNATQGGIEFRYTRNDYKLSYLVGQFVNAKGEVQDSPVTGTLKTVSGIEYEAPMANYGAGGADYYEPPHQNNYTFAGWYIDAACTTPVDFSDMTMPLNGVTVYGKWILNEYRVFLHPNVPSSDTTLNWGSETQQMCFRVSAGNKISAPTGTRIGSGYEMVGWYTDEACTKVFNGNAFVLNDTTVTTPYDMSTDFTDVMDKYGEGATYNNDDADHENRYWIEKKLDLYAKWRAILVGADGIGIKYYANGGTGVPEDSTLYQDTARAIAQGASTAPEGQQFVCWVLQSWDNEQEEYADTNIHVYPGDDFEVLLQDAKAVELPESTPEHPKFSYTIQLRAEYAPKEVPTPTHLTWYANYEGGGSITDNNLQINKAVDIKGADTFTRDGYEFIGWARVPTTNDDGTAMDPAYELSPKNLTASDLFLIYDKEHNRFTTSDGTVVTQVAADEKYPYHDLYAVWEKKDEFYVFHSSDCSVETYYVDDYKDGNFNIASKVKSGHLYAGYYNDYAGKGNYNNDGKAPTSGTTNYTLANVSSITWSNPCTANGTAFTPAKDTTYYLKELPNAYLQTSQYEVVHNGTNLVHKEYLVAGIDDNNYDQIGFTVRTTISATKETSVSDYDHVPTYGRVKENNYAEGDGNETTITNTTYKTISDFYSTISTGSVAVQEISVPASGTITLIEPYLVTPDGVKVTSVKIRRITTSDKDGDGQISISEMTIQNLGNRSTAVYVAMSDAGSAPALYMLAYTDTADVEKRRGKKEQNLSEKQDIFEPVSGIIML